MWTYTDDLSLIENITVRGQYKDGVLKFYEIYPMEGYVLRIPCMDEYLRDEEGNLVADENGKAILETPYRSRGGATQMPDYDWTTNPEGYYAELYEEGMIIY